MTPRRSNFTLTEILVVIAISAIVLAVALPSFQKLGEARATQNLTGELRAALMQAQAIAATSGKRVAVLIDATGSYIAPDRQSRRLCFVRKVGNTAGTYDFLGWTEDDAWRKFPQGALINPTGLTRKITFNTNPTFASGETSFSQIPAVVFKPSGAIDFPTGTISLEVIEGILLDHTVIRRDVGTADSAPVKLGLNQFTGRAEIQ